MKKKDRIKYLEEKVSALTNVLSELDQRYMNNVSHTRTIRGVQRRQIDNIEKTLVEHRKAIEAKRSCIA